MHDKLLKPYNINKMKKWIIAICILITTGIVFSIIKTEKDGETLGDNYYYLSPYEAMDVGFPEGAIIYKSSQKNLFSDIKIHGDVITIKYDKDFIIAVQQKKSNTELVKDKMLYYFIIEKKSDSVTGPLSKLVYLQKREELKVPKELKLKEE